ncbi:MAG: radical SAM protein [Methanobacterium sp.]|nr:radical SAM protein [Methanobacterium sp.]
MNLRYLKELKKCKLCSWKCGVNRLAGEKGVCRVGLPEIAYTNFTRVLKSYSVTLLGCSFVCAYCNAYRISQYPDSGWRYRGYVEPDLLAEETLEAIETPFAQINGVNKLNFTGGEPSIHTPYLEEVVNLLSRQQPQMDVGLATNGFSTRKTMKRLIKFHHILTSK